MHQKPRILYEDNHIIVVVKPANMAVQSDSSGDLDLLTYLKDYIKVKYDKPGSVYLGLVHRLDRPVSGVMVFARTSKAAARLSDCFAKKTAKKRYLAIVCGDSAPSGRLECFMRKNESFSSEICNEHDSGAQFAALEFRTVAKIEEKGLSLVDINLLTGRHHQIRVQLMSNGTPIWGDHRYNRDFFDDNGKNIALFAYSLSFPHPTLKTEMTFAATPDWAEFSCLGEHIFLLSHGVFPVYIDENVFVADKPRGIEVAIADAKECALEAKVREALGEAYAVHRLDATTEGLTVFARNKAAKSELESAFSPDESEANVSKFYACTCLGHMQKNQETLCAYLIKDALAGRVRVTDSCVAGSQKILTRYRVLSEHDGLSDLEVELLTGRTHQIRAHLAHINHPVLGDDKYGDRERNKTYKATYPRLSCERLVFHFPASSVLCKLNNRVITRNGEA